jgi:hypothetical protein
MFLLKLSPQKMRRGLGAVLSLPSLLLSPLQEEGGITNNRYGTRVMHQRAKNRVKNTHNCQNNSGEIKEHGGAQIDHDCPHKPF